jgi:hypothetical protein
MKKHYALLAGACLLLGTALGRSQESAPAPLIAAPGGPAALVETPQPTLGARLLMLRQRVEDWTKLRLVSQEAATPMEPAAPAKEAQVVAPPPSPPAPPPLYAVGAPCLSASRPHRSCGEKLDDWLTYRRLNYDCCCCFPKCTPCCNPPLYTYFIGNCCVQPLPVGYGPRCGCGGCSSGAHRLAGLGLGHGNFNFRQWWDNFLFKHDESGADNPK